MAWVAISLLVYFQVSNVGTVMEGQPSMTVVALKLVWNESHPTPYLFLILELVPPTPLLVPNIRMSPTQPPTYS